MNEPKPENVENENSIQAESMPVDEPPQAADLTNAGDAGDQVDSPADPSDAPVAADERTLSDAEAALAAASDSAPQRANVGPLSGRVPGPLPVRRQNPNQPGSPPPAAPKGNPQPTNMQRPASPPAQTTQQRIEQEAAENPDEHAAVQTESKPRNRKGKFDRKREASNSEQQAEPVPVRKISVPSKRAKLSDDLEELLARELEGSGVEEILGGQAGMPMREALVEGQRVQAKVIKKTVDVVFVSLGGPDEGSIPFEQFSEEPEIGSSVEAIVRGFNKEDGLYVVVLPGQAIDANHWEDLDEGTVVEAYVESVCNGGVEAKVGSIRGFIPISQLEFRTEDALGICGPQVDVCGYRIESTSQKPGP
ncbi:MAG: hypothetical protein R3C05_24725 [Pirellulaceae bacterium]